MAARYSFCSWGWGKRKWIFFFPIKSFVLPSYKVILSLLHPWPDIDVHEWQGSTKGLYQKTSISWKKEKGQDILQLVLTKCRELSKKILDRHSKLSRQIYYKLFQNFYFLCILWFSKKKEFTELKDLCKSLTLRRKINHVFSC